MPTMIVIDDDVLVAARIMAERQNRSLGEIISDLARRSLHRIEPPVYRNGIPLLPVRPGAQPATLEIVNALRDESPLGSSST